MIENKKVSVRVPDQFIPLAKGFIEAYKLLPDDVRQSILENVNDDSEIGAYIVKHFLASYQRQKTMQSKNSKTALGSADSRINEVIDFLIDWNVTSIHDTDKVVISLSLLQKLTKSNNSTVKRVLSNRSSDLDAHYQAMGIDESKRNTKDVYTKIFDEAMNRGLIE